MRLHEWQLKHGAFGEPFNNASIEQSLHRCWYLLARLLLCGCSCEANTQHCAYNENKRDVCASLRAHWYSVHTANVIAVKPHLCQYLQSEDAGASTGLQTVQKRRDVSRCVPTDTTATAAAAAAPAAYPLHRCSYAYPLLNSLKSGFQRGLLPSVCNVRRHELLTNRRGMYCRPTICVTGNQLWNTTQKTKLHYTDSHYNLNAAVPGDS